MNMFFISCDIERGGFSSERTFIVRDESLVANADVDYLRTVDHKKLDDNTPRMGEVIQGFVACRKIQDEGNSVLIEVPSRDTMRVAPSKLHDIKEFQFG